MTFRLISRGLSRPLLSNRLSGLPGILSNSDVAGLFDACKKTTRDLHQSCLSQPFCIGSTLNWNVSQRSSTYYSSHRISRLYSSQTENDSLGQLVYKGRVSKMFKALKIFSLTTSAIGLSFQPYMWITYQNMPLSAAVPFFAVLNCFVFVNPILIHYISKKYVTELYFNSDTKVFTAYVLTFFARREAITFTAADVHVPDVPNMFAMLTVKGRPFFVNESDFTSIKVYKHLMGFDQPLDLTLLHEESKNPAYLQDNKKDP